MWAMCRRREQIFGKLRTESFSANKSTSIWTCSYCDDRYSGHLEVGGNLLRVPRVLPRPEGKCTPARDVRDPLSLFLIRSRRFYMLSMRTLREIRSILSRAISRAQAREKVKRDVVLPCEVPNRRKNRGTTQGPGVVIF